MRHFKLIRTLHFYHNETDKIFAVYCLMYGFLTKNIKYFFLLVSVQWLFIVLKPFIFFACFYILPFSIKFSQIDMGTVRRVAFPNIVFCKKINNFS